MDLYFLIQLFCLLVPVYSHITTGCKKDMRLFGPNNHYRCHCEKLDDCDFANNGKCRNAKCQKDYGGPFCQMKLYGKESSQRLSSDLNIFTKDIKEVKNNFQIRFNKKYNINKITMTCEASGTKFSVYIGQILFCDMSCSKSVTCTGDKTGGNMSITSQSYIGVSNMEMTGCSPLWFGVNCDKQCHCDQNSECHKITGHCPTGCESGRSGVDCQTLNYVNVALNKRTFQWGTIDRGVILANGTCREQSFRFSSNLAVDGNTDLRPERKSCMHSRSRGGFWRVDLGRTYHIKHIRIYNADSEYSDDLIGSRVLIDGELCQTVSKESVKAPKTIDIFCPSVLQGSVVEINSDGDKSLHFCEVEVLQCLPGFYGNRCSKSCPECKDSCNQTDGKCLSGCAPGFKRNQPRDICTACSYGNFGDRCSKNCHCENNDDCDKTNGNCGAKGCSKGYMGSNCQRPCSYGNFGDRCSKTCHCQSNDDCNKTNGNCGAKGCSEGYMGYNCQIPCHLDTFGRGCFKTCHCKDNKHCDRKTGTCEPEGCEAGYKGYNCQELTILTVSLWIIVAIFLVFILLLVVNILIFYRIWQKKSKRTLNVECSEAINEPPLNES